MCYANWFLDLSLSHDFVEMTTDLEKWTYSNGPLGVGVYGT